eukprot:1190038-Prorocentrum_minimum.AAC.1
MLAHRLAFSVLRAQTRRTMAPTTRSLKRAAPVEPLAADMGDNMSPEASRRRNRVPVKLEYEEEKPGIPMASASTPPRGKSRDVKTPTKTPTKTPKVAASQKTPTARSPPKTPSSKLAAEFKPPDNWPQVLSVIKAMRAPGGIASNAAVDTMGCDRCHEDGSAIPDEVRRFQILVAAMLSSQTRDEITHAAMMRLRKHGLTPQNILRCETPSRQRL